jgi:hypothetical protein
MTTGVEMDLFLASAGPLTVAFAAAQIAGVAPYPADLDWKPDAAGVLGDVPGVRGGEPLRIFDPVTLWHRRDMPASGGEHMPIQPTSVLVLAGNAAALAVDRYVLSRRLVHPASPALRPRGVYGLAPAADDYAIVLDLSRLVV